MYVSNQSKNTKAIYQLYSHCAQLIISSINNVIKTLIFRNSIQKSSMCLRFYVLKPRTVQYVTFSVSTILFHVFFIVSFFSQLFTLTWFNLNCSVFFSCCNFRSASILFIDVVAAAATAVVVIIFIISHFFISCR